MYTHTCNIFPAELTNRIALNNFSDLSVPLKRRIQFTFSSGLWSVEINCSFTIQNTLTLKKKNL